MSAGTIRVRRVLRPPLAVLLTAALVASLLVTSIAVRSYGRVDAAGPVSGAIGLGGGLSGSVDERTGLFSVSVPVVSVGGPGSAGVTWSLVWDQARAVDGVDRSGFGAGLVAGGVVHRARDAGARCTRPTAGPTGRAARTRRGCENYPLQDLVSGGLGDVRLQLALRRRPGRRVRRRRQPGLPGRPLREPHRADLAGLPGRRWAPSSIIDGYGLTTTFTYTRDRGHGVGPGPLGRRRRDDDDHAGRPAPGDDGDGPGRRDSIVRVHAGRRASTVDAAHDGRLRVAGPARRSPTRSPADQPASAVESVVDDRCVGNGAGSGAAVLAEPGRRTPTITTTPATRPTTAATTDRLFDLGRHDYRYTTSISAASSPACRCPPPVPARRSRRCRRTTRSTGWSPRREGRRRHRAAPDLDIPAGRAADTGPATTPGRRRRRSTYFGDLRQPRASTPPRGYRTATTHRAYDNHGRVTASTDETGATTATTYDDATG